MEGPFPNRWHGLGAVLLIGFAAFAFLRRGDPSNATKDPKADLKSGGMKEVGSNSGSSGAPSAGARNEIHPFLVGDPKVIQAVQAELERTDLSQAEREKLWADLKEKLDPLLVAHGIHALPLFSRVLSDPRLPQDLRSAALSALGRLPYPQNADFLARQVASGKVCPDTGAFALHTLGRLMSALLPIHRTEPLRALCGKILEDSLQSTEPGIRSAAIEQLFPLSPALDEAAAVQRLYLVLHTDPAQEVRTAAEAALLGRPDLLKGNEWLAQDARSIVLATGEEADRARALKLLVATGTDAAKSTVLTCLGDGADRVRKIAILAAGTLKLPEAVPALANLLKDPKAADLQLRQQYVLVALAGIPGEEAAGALLACASEGFEPELRGAAVAKLRDNPSIADERFGRALVALSDSLPEGALKDNSQALLARSKAPEAYESLYRGYSQANGDTRDRLASLLLQSPRRGDFVQSSFAQLVQTSMAAQAIAVLAETAPDRAVLEVQSAYVTGRGQSLDEDARHSAIRALGRIGSANARTVLKTLLEIEEDRDLRSEISSALDQLKR